MKIAALVLFAQLTTTAPPACGPNGDHFIAGQFPYFSCIQTDPNCIPHVVPCTPGEIALILGIGGKVQPPEPPRSAPTLTARRDPGRALAANRR